jgi:methylenetetrahydrofolate dehydrogenase (NADP+)/methenyltetrahydrofolate cyclohydrolase
METRILQGTGIQERIFTQVKMQVMESVAASGNTPGIAFISFEGVPLSKYSIPLHLKVATDSGFRVFHDHLPADVSFANVQETIRKHNEEQQVHAIVILQPVPPHLNPILVENLIRPEKEVEGFHPMNMLGTMLPEIGINPYPMCLPSALKEILTEEGVSVRPDDEWLFVLDDEFFTNPLTMMIVRASASRVVPKESPLTFINKESHKLEEHIRKADFLVVVSKFPCYLDCGWLKPGVTIIDIYSNLVREVTSKQDPSRLVPVIRGGVDIEKAKGTAGNILGIPGGLMTVVLAILLRNAIQAFIKSEKAK